MRAEVAVSRRGFTLVELLVVAALITTLAGLLVSAVSAVRDNGKSANTATAIARLDQVVTNQFRRYEWQSVPTAQLNASIANRSAARAWHIRRNRISADMPDRWPDVAYMAANPSQFPSSAQASYIATYNAANPKPTDQYGGAECLFMIVMQGGFADCLDCNGLAQITKGDKDGDGAPEFWDDWSNPIDYILWAPGFQKTGATDPFFTALDTAFPGSGIVVRPGLGMRPLIYSAGPDGQYSLQRNGEAVTLSRGSSPTGINCGNKDEATTATSGAGLDDGRNDNIVNVELTTGS